MDDVGRLVHYAGAREAVDSERMELARARVAAHWDNVVAERRRGRMIARQRLLAVAASLVAAVGATFVYVQLTGTPAGIALAMVDRVIGNVAIANEPAAHDAAIEKDTLIETGNDGRIALRLAGGQSLRIDTESRLVVHSGNHVSLQQGGVYIDTEGAIDVLPVLVTTPLGTARDVGTQFQVRLSAAVLSVGVRDGMVQVATEDQQSLAVNKGRYLELASSGVKTERQVDSDDPSWDWIETIAPEFAIEGATLRQYLEWFSNERGIELNWEDGLSEQNADKIVLSGSISGETLNGGLEIVRQIAPFEYRIDGDSMWVKVN